MIHFRVEGIPPSYNQAFKINYNFREVYLSAHAKQFKNKIKMQIPPISGATSLVYAVDIKYVYNWYYKNGRLKKKDTQNCDKLLYDAISEQLGIDDSRFKKRKTTDVHSKEECYTEVSIEQSVHQDTNS